MRKQRAMDLQWEPAGLQSTWERRVVEIAVRDVDLIWAHLPKLMVWLQDLNWPGAQLMADFLAGLGAPVLPHVRAVLQGTDREWQYGVLTMLVARWPQDLVTELTQDLLALASRDTYYGSGRQGPSAPRATSDRRTRCGRPPCRPQALRVSVCSPYPGVAGARNPIHIAGDTGGNGSGAH